MALLLIKNKPNNRSDRQLFEFEYAAAGKTLSWLVWRSAAPKSWRTCFWRIEKRRRTQMTLPNSFLFLLTCDIIIVVHLYERRYVAEFLKLPATRYGDRMGVWDVIMRHVDARRAISGRNTALKLLYYKKLHVKNRIFLLLCSASFSACISILYHPIVVFYEQYTCTPCVLLSFRLCSIELSPHYHPSVLKQQKNPLVWNHRYKGPKYRTFYEINSAIFAFSLQF